MNIKRQYIKIVVGVFLSSLMVLAHPIFGDDAPKSDANQSQSKAKGSVDSGWLPNITGLPDEQQVDVLTRHVTEVMAEEQDEKCNAINYNLRLVVFQNFVIYQQMANAQNVYFKEKMALKYAHVLAMILKESSGDTTNVTDMTGRSVATSHSQPHLQEWKNLLKNTLRSRIKFNVQTNFGLTQLSPDRLFVAFKLAQSGGHGKDFLEGKSGANSAKKVVLNTAIAIRRIIWVYQDFAQGRLTQDDNRIHQEDIYKPEFNERYQRGLKLALLYCGTRYLFNADKQYVWENEYSTFENAMASIAYCKLGNSKKGYGKQDIDEQCFAEWVTLCPALNINIALITPLSYFQTRGEKPICVSTFMRLLNKKPEAKQ